MPAQPMSFLDRFAPEIRNAIYRAVLDENCPFIGGCDPFAHHCSLNAQKKGKDTPEGADGSTAPRASTTSDTFPGPGPSDTADDDDSDDDSIADSDFDPNPFHGFDISDSELPGSELPDSELVDSGLSDLEREFEEMEEMSGYDNDDESINDFDSESVDDNDDDLQVHCTCGVNVVNHQEPALTQTCTQIRTECLLMYYNINTFCFVTRTNDKNGLVPLVEWLRGIGEQKRAVLTKIHIVTGIKHGWMIPDGQVKTNPWSRLLTEFPEFANRRLKVQVSNVLRAGPVECDSWGEMSFTIYFSALRDQIYFPGKGMITHPFAPCCVFPTIYLPYVNDVVTMYRIQLAQEFGTYNEQSERKFWRMVEGPNTRREHIAVHVGSNYKGNL